MAFLLRIKSKSGQYTLDSLTSTSSIKELKEKLISLTKIEFNRLHILYGYPPKPLFASNDVTINSSGIKSGDTLLIEELKQPLNSQRNSIEANCSSNIRFQLHRHPVPANNSCLFTSIDFILNGANKINLNSASSMRKLIARAVASNPEYYTEAFLGKLNVDYQKWICDDQHWGGAIEISILSKHHSIEIAVIDIESGQLYRYGEDANYPTRIFLIYDGIHYDPIIGVPQGRSLPKNDNLWETVQSIFLSSDDVSIVAALTMAQDEKMARKFTNINSASYQCIVCGIMLKGQTDLQRHSIDTKHSNFKQI